MAFGTSAAQGAGTWLITNGAETWTGQTLLANLKSQIEGTQISFLTYVLGIHTRISCTAMTLEGMALTGTGLLDHGYMVFTGCHVFLFGAEGEEEEEAPECVPSSEGAPAGKIKTVRLKGELVLHTGEITLVKLTPLEGTVFAKFTFGGECVLGEQFEIEGTLFLKDCEAAATQMLVTHLVEEHSLSTLKMFKEPLKVLGSVNLSLVGAMHQGLKWGAIAP
jgi:hypothetical protein